MSLRIITINTERNLTIKKAIELSFENFLSLTPSKNSFRTEIFSRSIEGNEDLYAIIESEKITHKEAINKKHSHKEMIVKTEETSNLLISLITERLVNKKDSNRNLI